MYIRKIKDIIMNYSENELSDIFFRFGESYVDSKCKVVNYPNSFTFDKSFIDPLSIK